MFARVCHGGSSKQQKSKTKQVIKTIAKGNYLQDGRLHYEIIKDLKGFKVSSLVVKVAPK